jgi:protein-disulfide isomerase
VADQNKALLTQQQMVWGGAALAIVVLLALGWFLFGGSDANSATESGNAKVVLVPTDRTLGNPKAPILMVEYASMTCSHCARFNNEVFKKLKAKYIDTGKVYYVFREFPLDMWALQASALARCLPADNYFAFVDLLFENQEKWAFGGDPHGGLVSMGRMAGLGEAKVDACMTNQAELDRIKAVAQDGATKYKINGTPTFVVDGTIKSGEFTWDMVQAFLDPKLGGKQKTFWQSLGAFFGL